MQLAALPSRCRFLLAWHFEMPAAMQREH